METLTGLPVLDIIAGVIIALISLFLIMTYIAIQQTRRVRQLEFELYEAGQQITAWVGVAKKHLQRVIQLEKQQSRTNENN